MIKLCQIEDMGFAACVVALSLLTACSHHPEAVTTYHYDNLRTGWNSHEDRLTPAKVSGPKFGLLHSLTLDDEVDTQPLLVPDIDIKGGSWPGKHDVVYVATEGDTVYAIDAKNGAVLLSPNFGLPVQLPQIWTLRQQRTQRCINGTPVIDRASETMYVIIYTLEAAGPIYRIHALNLHTLTDKVAPVEVKATSGGYNFIAAWQRQRPGLVLANGNVYAGLEFLRIGAGATRAAGSSLAEGPLTPLAATQLNDRDATAPNNAAHRFLASVWMSGYGLAADPAGSILRHRQLRFELQQSKQHPGKRGAGSPDLATIKQLFTPANQGSLDGGDWEFGSGGAMLLPDQPGGPSFPHLAAAAEGHRAHVHPQPRPGHNGRVQRSDRTDKVIGMVNIGGCWCGQSLFCRLGWRRPDRQQRRLECDGVEDPDITLGLAHQ